MRGPSENLVGSPGTTPLCRCISPGVTDYEGFRLTDSSPDSAFGPLLIFSAIGEAWP
jgi:hypothetical protein